MAPSSSSSSLSAKVHGQPPSSLSRPVSRSTSRLSTPRPASSLSTRPGSSASMRPQSRFSTRPHSRHARSRLIPNVQKLVAQVAGLQEDGSQNDPEGDLFQDLVEYSIRQLESSTISKASASVDMIAIDKHIRGHTLKARINSKDVLAEALEAAYQELKAHIEGRGVDLDQEIKTSHIPDHLQFLLALNRPPTDGTLVQARAYLETVKNPPRLTPALTWADILAEEPFEGEHWEGIFASPRNQDDSSSSLSLSPLNSGDLALDEADNRSSEYEEPFSLLSSSSLPLTKQSSPKTHNTFVYQEQLERLYSKQYWREEWHSTLPANTVFHINDPSTLGPALGSVLATNSGFQDAYSMLRPERYIDEDDMVREVLLALQGNRNIVFSWIENSFRTTAATPRLNHLSLTSQASILSSFAQIATTVELLRSFSGAIFAASLSSHNQANKSASTTRTCEAFADAIDEAVRRFDAWCSAREEAICRARVGAGDKLLVVSLMGTQRAIRDQYETFFEVLLSIVCSVFHIRLGQDTALFQQATPRRQPAAITACLLNTLFSAVQENAERRELVTSNALMKIFVRTAEPTWAMMGKWLTNGMGLGLGLHVGGKVGSPLELDDEFFIESSGVGLGMMGMGLLDPDFWNEGYGLREVSTPYTQQSDDRDTIPSKAVPLFLEHVASLVLGTGKAVGLLSALDELPPSLFSDWKTFEDLVSCTQTDLGSTEGIMTGLSASNDTLSRLIFDTLLPECENVAAHLVNVLVVKCFLWKHIGAIEDLFFMRKGDIVSHFLDLVFSKMDSSQPWTDFHFLNAAFTDVVNLNMTTGAKDWINPSLVRFSYRGGKDNGAIRRTVKAIDRLAMEYAVPFPLTYIFPPSAIHGYGEVFIFLMQIRRAKNVLERILVRDERVGVGHPRDELKAFFAIRSRLSWFTNMLLNFITTYVIHAEVSRFHKAFRKAQSLDDMIQIHDDHMDKVRSRCLLKPNTSALHRTVVSILDMCLHFSEGFVAFTGDTTATLDLSRHSVIVKRHRSRRQKRSRKNVIAFSQYVHGEDDSSDEDEAETVDEDTPEPSYSMLDVSTNSDDFLVRVEKMSVELDSLIRFLRRGVESLAGGCSEAAPAFGVLAFSLEDWDL